MLFHFREYIRINKCVRLFSCEASPITMAYNVFESKHTDNTKPPLIIMHGLFGSKQNWSVVSRSLEAKTNRKIINLDARNHGESPHTREHSSIHMALDIIELMKQMDVKKSSVMGHSMGGRTMMLLALKYPEYVKDGIIVDISPISMPQDFSQIEKIVLAIKNVNIPGDLSMGDGRKFAETAIKEVVSQKETVDFILMNLRKNYGKFSWAVNFDAIHKNLGKLTDFMDQLAGLEPYKGRMMFVCGRKSKFVDPKSWPQIQTLFPNSEIHWLDAGHLVHFDQPVKFLELLVKFLNK